MSSLRPNYLVAVMLAMALNAPLLAQTAMPMPAAEIPESADPDRCLFQFNEGEALVKRAASLADAKRFEEAIAMLRDANAKLATVEASCQALAPQAAEAKLQAAQDLQKTEAVFIHKSKCQPSIDLALESDIKGSTARRENKDPAEVERHLSEAEGAWRAAVAYCQSPVKERAERNLAATQRVRAANAELLSAGPACEGSWKTATGLVDLAKTAGKEKNWEEATSLYNKAMLAWERAADVCSGSRHDQALKRAEQMELEMHNAEYCGPLWDVANEHSQAMKAKAAAASIAERTENSIRAEVGWREAASLCKGPAQSIAKTNADTLARERGAPLPPNSMQKYGKGVSAPAPVVTQVVPSPVIKPQTQVASASAIAPPAQKVVEAGAQPVLAPPRAPVKEVPPAVSENEPRVLVVGDTTYRGVFSVDPVSGKISGKQVTVEWPSGERYIGPMTEGMRHGRGRYTWKDGGWYEGDYKNDRASGNGVILFPNASRYEGTVVDGRPQGRGVMQAASGDKYTGEFFQGEYHGQGTYAWQNGNVYTGSWVMGQKHGQGRMVTSSGIVWEGEFKNDGYPENSAAAASKRSGT